MVQNATNQADQLTIEKLMELSRWAAAERTQRDRSEQARGGSSSRGAQNAERE